MRFVNRALRESIFSRSRKSPVVEIGNIERLTEVDGIPPGGHLGQQIFGAGMGKQVVVEQHHASLAFGDEVIEGGGPPAQAPLLVGHYAKRTPLVAPSGQIADGVGAVAVETVVRKRRLDFGIQAHCKRHPGAADADVRAVNAAQSRHSSNSIPGGKDRAGGVVVRFDAGAFPRQQDAIAAALVMGAELHQREVRHSRINVVENG
ncbi:MAG: hypothetical protein ABIG68_13445 [Acidobacteriota bacterium]